MKKFCPVCKKIFESNFSYQIYCCVHCRKVHHKKVYYNKPKRISNIEDNEPILKQFYCKKCHVLVTITNIKDRRKKFCSPHCEKLYWKHPKPSTCWEYDKKESL